MPNLCDSLLCTGCHACASVCTQNSITMQPDAEGFLRPSINPITCINCNLCEKVCPILTPPAVSAETPDGYAAINQNESERAGASSGGMFILLARWVLDRNGVVFGAAFDKDYSVSHQYAETEDGVYRFCGSKYVQSWIGNAYQQAKAFLVEGQYVLFSGTPCQISGLVKFLGKEYEKLLTVDIVCHGVPSPDVWQRYVKYRADKDNNGNLPETIHFRSKVNGWKEYSIHFQYADAEYCVPYGQDSYMHGFIDNLYLRSSCHRCISKGLNRVSDFTLADFWGIQCRCPEMDDDRGTSLILIHTEKAKGIWAELSDKIRFVQIDPKAAVQSNSAAIKPVEVHPKRDEFFARYRTEDFDALVWELAPKYVPPKLSLYRRIRGKLGRIVRCIIRK